jgi:hypothetical protein
VYGTDPDSLENILPGKLIHIIKTHESPF